MAVTKILARNARLDQAIQYVLNGDKTDHQSSLPIRTATLAGSTAR